MRFTKDKELREAYDNNIRTFKNKFLWFPVTINGETRWLETANILYSVEIEQNIFFSLCYYWSPCEFLNK